MKFLPRRDLWLSVVIWSCVLVLVGSGLSPLFVEGAGLVGGTVLLLVCFAFAGLLVWLWIGTSYIFDEKSLIVRMGPVTKTIPLKSIKNATPVKSWIASGATSSRRIEISFGAYESIHISPLDEEGFLDELKKKCPYLQV